MNVRSITAFIPLGQPRALAASVDAAGQIARAARSALETAGMAVQTTRLATDPLSTLWGDPLRLASDLWSQCAGAGFDYLSLGPVLADTPGADLSTLELVADLIRTHDSVFAGILVARQGSGIHLKAIQQAARIVREIAHSTEQGFGNLRLAILANVAPHAPFFPAAYHDGGAPALGLAIEGADLAVSALSQAGSLEEARQGLVVAVEQAAQRMTGPVQPLVEQHGYRYAGIDFSLAPFPQEARSIGAAIERLGVARFGAAGTLFAASFLTDCLRRARYARCGFNGLMLPVLEDAILAARSREKLFSVNDLLLYSAVCGTGLDTVPLPGDVSEEELAGILLDVAALSLRLDKPLTARLMPIPGAAAGDPTQFDFAYFANGHVLDVKGYGSQGLFDRAPWLAS